MSTLETEEQQVEAIKKWWQENGKSLIAGIVIGLGGIVGWQGWQTYQIEQAEARQTAEVALLGRGCTEDHAADRRVGVKPHQGQIQGDSRVGGHRTGRAVLTAGVICQEDPRDNPADSHHMGPRALELVPHNPGQRIARLNGGPTGPFGNPAGCGPGDGEHSDRDTGRGARGLFDQP